MTTTTETTTKSNEMLNIIAEAEGAKTPKKKRTQADVDAAFDSFTKKRAAKKMTAAKPKTEAADKPKKSAKARAEEKPPEVKVTTVNPAIRPEPIAMNFISPTGYVREAGFDPKTSLFYVGFEKSAWAVASTQEAWDDFEKAVADPKVDIDAYYRKAFRGRSGEMVKVARVQEVAA